MKKLITVNELDEILRKAFGCKSCITESISCKTKNGFDTIRIGFGKMLDLHLELKD